MITRTEIEGMLRLAETDNGMADLLAKAKEFYILKGSPPGDGRFEYKESYEERRNRILNTRFTM